MEKSASCTLVGRVELAGVRSNPPAIQLFIFTEAGEVIGSSDYKKPKGSMLSDAVVWDMLAPTKFQFEIRLDLVPAAGMFFPILVRVRKSGNLFTVAQAVQYSLHMKDSPSKPIFTTDPVSLAEDDGELDWFVLGVVVVDRNAVKKVASILFRDVSSFPATKGDVASQLKELVGSVLDDLSEGQIEGEGWYSVPVPPELTDLSSPTASEPSASSSSSSASSEEGMIATFGPGTPTFSPPPDCANCAILLAELKSKRSEDIAKSEGIEEVAKLREKLAELEQRSLKQEIMIEKLRSERKQVLVTQLVGEENLTDPNTDELDQPSATSHNKNVIDAVADQEILIMSIKEQLLKLSSQIRNGQRIRAIR